MKLLVELVGHILDPHVNQHDLVELGSIVVGMISFDAVEDGVVCLARRSLVGSCDGVVVGTDLVGVVGQKHWVS